MGFVFGALVGALGLWAYQGKHLQRWLGRAPQPVQDAVQQVGSTVGNVKQQVTAPEIIRPTEAEIAGRPAEPLPRKEPEGIHTVNS